MKWLITADCRSPESKSTDKNRGSRTEVKCPHRGVRGECVRTLQSGPSIDRYVSVVYVRKLSDAIVTCLTDLLWDKRATYYAWDQCSTFAKSEETMFSKHSPWKVQEIISIRLYLVMDQRRYYYKRIKDEMVVNNADTWWYKWKINNWSRCVRIDASPSNWVVSFFSSSASLNTDENLTDWRWRRWERGRIRRAGWGDRRSIEPFDFILVIANIAALN